MTISSKVYKRRLLKLADFLDELPKERFDYREWVDNNWNGKLDISCNSKACAFGWASTIKSFRKLGLRLMKTQNFGYGYICLAKEDGTTYGDEFVAGRVIFGLTEEETSFLFIPNHPYDLDDGNELCSPSDEATPKQVAKHIRKFVKFKYGK